MKLHDANGTFVDTTATFGKLVKKQGDLYARNVSSAPPSPPRVASGQSGGAARGWAQSAE